MDLNVFRSREEFAKLVGRFGNKVQPNQYLQLEAQLQNGNPAVRFAVNSNDTIPAQRSSETRLNQNDAFAILAIGLFLKKEDPAKPGSGRLIPYPYATVFAAESGNLAPADLESVYNSKLGIKVGDTVYSNGMDMNPCRTENTAATERKTFDGFMETTALITLDGAAKNDVVLNISNWAGQQIQYATATERVYVVLKAYGFLISGGGGGGVGQLTR